MADELTERKAAGSTSNEGNNQLKYVGQLLEKVEDFVKGEFIPANPLCEYPKTLGF